MANKNLWGVAIALSVKLASAGEFMPSLKVLGNLLVQQHAFRVAQLVKLGRGFEVGRA